MVQEARNEPQTAQDQEIGAEAPDSTTDEFVGKLLGNYVIERSLARGGMGTVYVARHLSLDRLVAVKVLSDELNESPGLAGRFRDEARITANLRHPNIVEIFDFGTVDGHYYYVMELLKGQDLSTYLLGKGHLPVRVVVRCVQQICAALSAVHAAGIVHRDLKPGNVFVVGESPFTIKLVDFGIAKVSALGGERTRYGQIIGSPTHMSPEQALGYTDKITPQSDLYSLGAVAYEMLTGQPVFQHESEVMLLMMHIQQPFVPIRQLAPHVPDEVSSIIEACLAKEPVERPTSARFIMNQLAKVTGEDDYLLRLTSRESAAPTVDEAPVEIVGAPHNQTLSPVESLALEPPLGEDAPVASAELTADREEPLAVSAPSSLEPAALVLDQGAAMAAIVLSRELERGEDELRELSISEREILHRLLKRMLSRGDFPAFVRNVGEVSKRADSESAYSARQLGEAILKDYALTAKLLRIVNQSYAGRFGSKVFSVQHAVVLLGFDRVRSIATSISLFKSSANGNRGKRVTDSAVSSIVTGEIARSLAHEVGVVDADFAMICGMFRNLGHHLVVVYLPEEYDRILELRETDGIGLEAAAKRVLGVSLRKLGVGIAERWRLPERVLAAMAMNTTPGRPLKREEDRLGALSEFASALCEVVVSQSPGTWNDALSELLERHRSLVHLGVSDVPQLLRTVRKSFDSRYSSLGLDAGLSRFSHNVATLPPVSGPSIGDAAQSTHLAQLAQRAKGGNPQGGQSKTVDRAPQTAGSEVLPLRLAKQMASVSIQFAPRDGTPKAVQAAIAPKNPEGSAEDAGDGLNERRRHPLTQGDLEEKVGELAELLENQATRSRVLVMALELVSSYLELPRVIALVANLERKELNVRAAVGEDADALRKELCLPLGSRRARGDMFSSAFHAAKDVVVEDAFAPSARCLIPIRYFEALGSSSFVLLSCAVAGRTGVLLLADQDGPLPLPKTELLSTLGAVRALIVRAAR